MRTFPGRVPGPDPDDANGPPGGCAAMGDLAEPYVAGALEAREYEAFERHLLACDACQRQVRRYEDVMALLPHALAQAHAQAPAARHTLPAALKERVLAAVREAGAIDGERTVTSGTAASSPAAWSPATLPVSIAVLQSRSWSRRAGMIAAAAVVVLSLAGSAQLGVALARERALRQELALELAAVSGQQEIVLEVVDARDRVTRLMRPPADAPAAYARSYGKVYTRPDLPHVVAMVGRFPAPPAGQAYHLWVQLEGQVRLAGGVAVNAEGFGQLVFDGGRNGPLYDAAWITLQPPTPAPSMPQGRPIVRWDSSTASS